MGNNFLINEDFFANVILLNAVELTGIGENNQQLVEFLIKGEFPHPAQTQKIGDAEIERVFNQITKSWGRDIVVDYQHESMKAGRAVAAGWLKHNSIERTANGLRGVIEWTQSAADLIRKKEYRFLSPVLGIANGVVTTLVNIGLTNNPNMHAIPALTNHYQGENKMDLKKFLKLLGLSETETNNEVVANAITDLQTRADAGTTSLALVSDLITTAEVKEPGELKEKISQTVTTLNSITQALGVSEPAQAQAKASELAGGSDALSKIVNEQAVRLTALESEKRIAVLDTAIKAGKITPEMKPTYAQLLNESPTLFDEMVGKLTPVIPGTPALGGTPAGDGATLTENEIKMCQQMGVTQEKFLATKQANEKKLAERQ